MYVCTYVCIYVCMYAYVYVYNRGYLVILYCIFVYINLSEINSI